MSELHALCFLSVGLRPHEALGETCLEGLLLIFWKVLLLNHLLHRVNFWLFILHEQTL